MRHDRLKTPPQEGERGIEALSRGESKRGCERRPERPEDSQYSPLRTPVTSNHQYLRKLSLSSSWHPVRGDCVARDLRPRSELVTMSREVEGDVEFAPVLGVGRWAAIGKPPRGRKLRGPQDVRHVGHDTTTLLR